MNFGYWVFGKDMNNVNLENLKKKGITDIFLNYYAFTVHGKSNVLLWIRKAKQYNINVHIWVQCFYDGNWINPATTNMKSKIDEITSYASLEGVEGIHLDYLRYPGNAYRTNGGAEAITKFVKDVKSRNPNIFLSCAVMPEDSAKYYYGQDFNALGKIVNAIIPMQYKGNYNAGTSWLESTTKMLVKNGTIWSGLQTYKSDSNTNLLTEKELLNDSKTCLDNGAEGIVLFRYGISPDVDFTTLSTQQQKTESVNMSDYYTYEQTVQIAKNIKQNVEKDYKLGENTQWSYFIAKQIVSPKQNVKKWYIQPAPSSNGDNLNTQIYFKDYMDMAKRLIKFADENKTLPNYISWNGKKVNVNDYTYMFARILVYHNDNKAYPNYANVKTSAFTKPSTTTTTTTTNNNRLNAYMTNTGCSGMGQCTGYNCAPNSLQQCFFRLTGILVPESTIASWAGTTTSGTSHDGISTAVAKFNQKYNKNVKITWKNFSELGSSASARWSALQSYINKGAVFCHLLYRDQYGHYEVPKSVGDSNLSILNSLGNKCNSPAYCGYIETRSKSAQLSYINGISQKSIAILTI